MKVTVNVECTPEEARTFMGLPDVQPMQEALMSELQQRLSANLQALSPENMMQAWLPTSLQGAENMRKMAWNQMQQLMAGVVGTTNAVLTVKDKEE